MNISPSAFHPVVHSSLPPQPVASQATNRIERSNITPGHLAKFLHDRTVRESHVIAARLCLAAGLNPHFNAATLEKQLKDAGFVDIRKPDCDGDEKHRCITGLLQHLQEESLSGEGVDGPETAKFCQLVKASDSCLGRGWDWLIKVMNEHQQLLEAGSRLTFDRYTDESLSLLCRGFLPCEGVAIDRTMNRGVNQQFSPATQLPGYSPASAAPSPPPAYDDVVRVQSASVRPGMPPWCRETEFSEQQRCARGLNVIASQLEHYSLDRPGTGTAMRNMADILGRVGGQFTPPEIVASGDRLTSLAQQLRMTSVNVFTHIDISTADIGVNIVGNRQDIQPVISLSWLPPEKFPVAVQARLKLARMGADEESRPPRVPIVQVYLCASSEKALEGAEFNVKLTSTIIGKYLVDLFHSEADNLMPIAVQLRMPKGLKKGADFHRANFALHSDSGGLLGCSTALFSHGQGESRGKEKHNIGIQQVAPILEAVGVDRTIAMSSEAGLAIPFGFTLKKQDDNQFVRRVKLLDAKSLFGGSSQSGGLFGSMNKPSAGSLYGGGTLFSGSGQSGGLFSGMYGGMNKPCAGSLYGGGTLFDGSSQSGVESQSGGSRLFGGGESHSADPIDHRNSTGAGRATTRDVALASDIEPKVNRLSTSGINPLPCATEKKYIFATEKPPEVPFVSVAGIVWVQTVTSLPGIETSEDLRQWIGRQKVDQDNPVLPGIL
ncbi:nucleoporin [Endozoicomonas sp. ONNA2]|uniref:nucleoporin FG repeat-containing protein n=1 Tax=Endozoicomonas sp. ONNA2 TaxID=2828741 RepID=UPI0021481E54|nr:nucleoporin [Endozoicomonas sp. ONNA2]